MKLHLIALGTIAVCMWATVIAQEEAVPVTDKVIFEISSAGQPLGKVTIGLFGTIVPKTVQNFVTFAGPGVEGKKYEGSKFHRIIQGFMIQGGDVVSGDGMGSLTATGEETFPDENFTLKHVGPGILSMANTGPDTNGCQFFLTTAEAPHLDGKHVVFGKVIEGMDVVRSIESVPTEAEDKPVTDVIIAKSSAVHLPTPITVNMYE